jgi:glucans biosynthesis protein
MRGFSRRSTLTGLLGSAVTGLAPAVGHAAAWPSEITLGPAQPFSFERLTARAAALATRPYHAPATPPWSLLNPIDYDAFGRIRYRPEASPWNSGPPDQSIRFFPLSRYARAPVAMNVVSDGQARAIAYSPALFDMPPDSPARALGAAGGFAGFKALNADHRTDWIAYLGASYFRSADPFNQYGLSARGLAIDTATPGPEEFPTFTEFWLEHAAGGLVVYALLDGPSVAGAYRITHQRSTAGLVQEIEARLRFRSPVKRLGIAPLTSMYWYGLSDRARDADWRPQIHDSDGLSIWTGAGERIWRPLANPPHAITNTFSDRSPRGFGLMQRDRAFEDYQDDGVFYDRRPSVWVEPIGDWGAGSVQLVELPTTGETDDNIVAFWTPAAPVTAGQSLDVRYRLRWTRQEPEPFGVARVVATRGGRGGRPGEAGTAGRRKFVVDFAGASFNGLGRQSGVEAVVDVRPGAAIDAAAYPVVGQDRWRLMFDVDMPAGKTVDMRAFLRKGGQALTETWIYQLIGA